MRTLIGVFWLGMTSLAWAEEAIIIKPVDRVERSEFEERHSKKRFCSKENEADAQTKCAKWLEEQKKNLGDKVLTTFCSDGEAGDTNGCLYKSEGEITFQIVVKK